MSVCKSLPLLLPHLPIFLFHLLLTYLYSFNCHCIISSSFVSLLCLSSSLSLSVSLSLSLCDLHTRETWTMCTMNLAANSLTFLCSIDCSHFPRLPPWSSSSLSISRFVHLLRCPAGQDLHIYINLLGNRTKCPSFGLTLVTSLLSPPIAGRQSKLCTRHTQCPKVKETSCLAVLIPCRSITSEESIIVFDMMWILRND